MQQQGEMQSRMGPVPSPAQAFEGLVQRAGELQVVLGEAQRRLEVARASGDEAGVQAAERQLNAAERQLEQVEAQLAQVGARVDAAAAAREAAALARAQRVEVRMGEPTVLVPGPPIGRQPDPVPENAVILTIAVMIALTLMVLGAPLMRALARRMDRKTAAMAVDPALREQLRHLEHAVDAIALEVERLGEGQRFAAQLEARAAAGSAVAAPPLVREPEPVAARS